MKKTLQISIAKTLFVIEEDAYAALDTYLNTVRLHFKNTDGVEEIISDIENRVSEQLTETAEKIITLPTVEKILDLMGTVEDFDENSEVPNETTKKKLYRSPEGALIAGVCSGISAYIGVDVVWVRIAFIVLTVLNGFGILLYVIFWLILPEALTKAQKLEMQGSPITLETLSENIIKSVNAKTEELKKGDAWKTNAQRLITLPFKIIGDFIKLVISHIGPLAKVTIGTVLVVSSIAVLTGLMVGGGIIISPDALLPKDIPLESIILRREYWILLGAAILVIAIPTLFILLGGISILRNRRTISGAFAFFMLTVWLIALIAGSHGTAKVITNYKNFTETSPNFETVTQAIPIEGEIKGLEVSNGVRITVSQSNSTSLTATGKLRDMEWIKTRVENGILIIDRPLSSRSCTFCFSEKSELALSLPNLNSITAKNGSYIDANFTTENVNILASNGARLLLSGSANSADIFLSFSSLLDGKEFVIRNALVKATHGSRATISVDSTLETDTDYGSSVRYQGNPKIIESSRNDPERE